MRKVWSITAIITVATALGAASANATQVRTGHEPSPANQGVTTGVSTVRELPGLRTETSNTFLQSDGSRLLRIADHPVNFKRGGTWVPIEDKLVEAGDGTWQPAASPVPVSLPAGLAGHAVTLGTGAHQVSFSLQGAEGVSGVASGDERSYSSVRRGVSASYRATARGVRETLTLANASAPSEYSYSLALADGLHAALTAEGGALVADAQGHTVYTIAAPTITDSSKAALASAKPVHYVLNAAGTVLTLVVDKSWLSSSSRVFPVRIDPDWYFGAVEDCSIMSGSAYENEGLCGAPLYVGHNGTENVTARSLLRYNLESVPKGSQVISSSIALWLRATSSSSNLQIDAYGVAKHAFTSGVTWNKYDGTHSWETAGGDHLKTLAGSTVVKPEYVEGWVSIGFSPQVEQWIRDPSSNYGILLKAGNESESNVDEFVQTEGGSGEEPDLNIVYEPQMGNPPNESMFQESIGNGATLGVNVANGNLHVTDPDVNYATEGYDTQLARSYNSYDDELVTGSIGNGWRLSMGEDELLYPAWWDGSNAFHEPDGSYTRFDRAAWADNHPEAGDEAYTGDAYRSETLVKHENDTRTLTYNETGVKWQFDNSENGFPQKIEDASGEGNIISLGYTASRLTKVTDTHGHELTLTREGASPHHVTKVKGAGAGEEWKYTYSSGNLVGYKGPGGQEANYSYGGTYGLLKVIEDPSGTTVVAYNETGQVTSLRHIVNGTVETTGSEDEVTKFTYEPEQEQTTVLGPTGTSDVYYYDEFGNVVEEPAAQEAATEFYAEYAEIESSAARKDVDLQDHAAILDSQLSQQLGGAYVGEWFNSSTGRLQIGATSAAYEQTIAADLSNLGLFDDADIVEESVSSSALEGAAHTLSEELLGPLENGRAAVGIEFSADTLRLETANTLTAEEESEVSTAVAKATVPVSVVKTALASLDVEPDSCSGGNCTPPLRGGVRIAAPEVAFGADCTAGFVTRSKANRKPYLLTAGHCLALAGGNGKRWAAEFPGDVLEFERTIGDSYSYVYSTKYHGVPGGTASNGDIGIIEIASSSVFSKEIAPYLIEYASGVFGTPRNERYYITKTRYSPQGHEQAEQFVVCMGGVPGGEGAAPVERCGFTKGIEYEAPAEGGGVLHNLTRFWLCHGSTVTSGPGRGTSGSPVYKNHEAVGIYVGSPVKYHGCLGLYEGISNAEGILGVTVVKN
jgi:hypothetical protein